MKVNIKKGFALSGLAFLMLVSMNQLSYAVQVKNKTPWPVEVSVYIEGRMEDSEKFLLSPKSRGKLQLYPSLKNLINPKHPLKIVVYRLLAHGKIQIATCQVDKNNARVEIVEYMDKCVPA